MLDMKTVKPTPISQPQLMDDSDVEVSSVSSGRDQPPLDGLTRTTRPTKLPTHTAQSSGLGIPDQVTL